MNEAANLLVRTAITMVERWRTDAFEGDLIEMNAHMEVLANAIHRVGVSPAEIYDAFAPNRNVVGFAELSKSVALVGTAIVASLEGIRYELRLKRGGQQRDDFRHRQASLDLAVNVLADRSNDRQHRAASDM